MCTLLCAFYTEMFSVFSVSKRSQNLTFEISIAVRTLQSTLYSSTVLLELKLIKFFSNFIFSKDVLKNLKFV